jgi:kynureninase
MHRTVEYSPEGAFAQKMDERDPLRAFRERFAIPDAKAIGGRSAGPCIYFAGNSLGLMPRATPAAVQQELEDWARLAVEGHLSGRDPWYSYHEQFRETGARLVGAAPGEVVMMNSLTVNLHLLMVSFYRPTRERHRIVVEDTLFPSDSYAVASQARLHGFDPAESVVRLKPRAGEMKLRTEDIIKAATEKSVALVMLGAVNYLSGQWFQMEPITRAAREAGAVVGWDLAHAAGNVPMRLHDWGVDFAAWCSYKYLNAGSGAVAGAFVHARHGNNPDLPRLAGWWGNDPGTRFQMRPEFVARSGADGWQLSNPPILAMAPLKTSLAIFEEAGLERLREKSVNLTGYLEFLLGRLGDRVQIVSPREPEERGCHLSVRVGGDGKRVLEALKREGVVCDFREPNIVRVAPVPLYNTFDEVRRFAKVLGAVLKNGE